MSDTPANWHPDPTGRHEYRYWDGSRWTDHVSDQGITGSDPVAGPPPGATPAADTPGSARMDRVEDALTVGDERKAVHEQITGEGRRGVGMTAPMAGGGGSILDEPVLVVNQKAKIIELNNQYSVFDQHGQQIAAVNQVGQSTAKKVLRLVGSVDQFMTHELEITDPAGAVVLRITRPRKFLKSTVIVADGAGAELGRVVQQNAVGKIRFGLHDVSGQELGTIRAENWRAWDFRIENAGGHEIARITKTWEGLAKTMFTTADNYVVQISSRAPEPLNSLVVASALSVDTALKQDNRGLG